MRGNVQHANRQGWPDRLEKLVMAGKARWDRMAPWAHHVLAALFIAGCGTLSPSAEIGEYRICLCNLAVGSAVVCGLVGGPSYAISAFCGLLFFNGTEGYSALSGNFVQISALTSLVVLLASWFVRKLNLPFGALRSNVGLLWFVLLGVVFPVAMAGIALILGVGVGQIAATIAARGMDLALKFVLQSLTASLLGILVCYVIFQVLYQLTEVSVYGFVRSSIFMVLTLSFLVAMYHVQARGEREVILNNLREQSTNVKNSLDYQISLQLRSIRNLEFLMSSYIADVLDEDDVQRFDFGNEVRLPLVFALCLERVEGNEWQQSASLGAAPGSDYGYRVIANNVFGNGCQEVSAFPAGSSVVATSPLGGVLHEVEQVDYRAKDLVERGKIFVFTQFSDQDDILVIAKPCFLRNRLVGIVLTGVSFNDFILEALEPFQTVNVGMRVSRRAKLNDPNSPMVPIHNDLFDANSFYKTQVSVGLNNSQVSNAVLLELSRHSDSRFFLTQSLENFSFYLLFVVIIGAMGTMLMNQYSRIDEKARQQVKSLGDKERYNSRIAFAMSDLLITIDADIKIISANAAAEKFFGVQEGALVGQDLHSVLHRQQSCLVSGDCELHAYAKKVSEYLVHDLHNEKTLKDRLTTTLRNAQGNPVCFELALSFMEREDGNHNVICVFRNIDRDVRLQKERSDYVASLSHEMRTPLSCIKGTVEMFLKFAPRMVEGAKFSAKGEQMLDVARRNIDKLGQLISDVLLCDSVENNTLSIQMKLVDVAPTVKNVIDNMKTIASKAGIKLRVGVVEGRAKVDTVRLDQVLTNLIGNAIKYSSSGSEIYVEARISEDKRDIVFVVSDQGEGIPSDKLSTIFDRFAVVSNDSVRKRGGLGLGLTICRGLVNAHGGKIWAESVLGQGSTFKFTLPQVNEPEQTASAQTAPFQ